jgi:hypothetical protein
MVDRFGTTVTCGAHRLLVDWAKDTHLVAEVNRKTLHIARTPSGVRLDQS